MRFADDLVIVAKSNEELARMMSILKEECSKVGFEIHTHRKPTYYQTAFKKPRTIGRQGKMPEAQGHRVWKKRGEMKNKVKTI